MIDLTTRNRRRRLQHRDRPHWVRIGGGRSLGYRNRQKGTAGLWYARVYIDNPDGSPYRWKSIGTADDLPNVEADGVDVLDYSQAAELARRWNFDTQGIEPEDQPPVTVADAVRRYLSWYEEHRTAYDRVRYSLEAHALPSLGNVSLDKLTTARLHSWHGSLAKKPARVRTSKLGKKKKHKVRRATTKDAKRARKVTANRNLAVLKAALNKAWQEYGVGDRDAWQRVKPFEKVDRARVRYLDRDEVLRLVNACDLDFRNVVLAALYTGARYGELIRLRVEDARLEAGGIFIAESKSGDPRTVYLNDEGATFFEGLSAGRRSDDRILPRADGSDWRANHQQRRMHAACDAADIKPRIVFHELRHSYASLYLMAGGGLPDLAKQLGHTSTRMVERHYGHLADQWRADRAREFAPAFGIKPGNVRRLSRQKTRVTK